VSTIEELLGRKSSGFGLESREYGRRNLSRKPRGSPYPNKFALTLPTKGGRSVGTIPSRTRATEFCFIWFECNFCPLRIITNWVSVTNDLQSFLYRTSIQRWQRSDGNPNSASVFSVRWRSYTDFVIYFMGNFKMNIPSRMETKYVNVPICQKWYAMWLHFPCWMTTALLITSSEAVQWHQSWYYLQQTGVLLVGPGHNFTLAPSVSWIVCYHSLCANLVKRTVRASAVHISESA
jgi:hypothetical protein